MPKTMKYLIVILLNTLLLTESYSQDSTFQSYNPDKIKEEISKENRLEEDMKKLREYDEKRNISYPTIQGNDSPQKKTELDQLIESLESDNGPNMSSNPATHPVAPKGVYNTSDTSKINTDAEIFAPAESSEKKNNHNTLILVGVIAFISLAIIVITISSK
ncbi:hypothetical protein [Chitinophaga barathri]|uniref:Uncharacterized protein n=1 Tax=Chitinophaga barathri TaxID=1647451 RepID=A0A3N4M5J6_9BACT|nr:hypothetical protein [Chitinophaga barathri]RPD38502.1 hypothetical protein EG028_24860 [Chitinophaga barathri]